ncbi:MAG TPA: di-heme-cytochrome C peroxidase [Terriglobales bacterium]|nr:di-heme-cytochrome C peroxidase [Terriglobales bacterium]
MAKLLKRLVLIAAVLAVVAVIGYCALFIYIEHQAAPAPGVDNVTVLDQGWGPALTSADRQTYYFTPQGVSLRAIPYDWLADLERPWKALPFASPAYMRGYGFIAAQASPANPGGLPVGFAARWDPASGQRMLDVTCALCHSGELDVVRDGVRTAVRIDGGPAMHDLTSTRLGHFSTDLLASLGATYLNPFKFRRFAARVLAGHDTFSARLALHAQLGRVTRAILSQAYTDSSRHLYPVEEGPGRTDALGRIANKVFATDLDPHNYRVADAPVSYPPVWDIWKFDWVQYTASVRQPMARNIGESLGTGADLSVLDAYGRPVPRAERYLVSTIVPNLRVIETTLQKLKPPCWPEGLLGKINVPLATEGAALFQTHCQICHGPHPASAIDKAFDAPLKTPDQPEWQMHTLAVDDIGTDPTAARNFVEHHFDLTATGLTEADVRAQLADTWRPAYERQLTRDAATLKTCVVGSANYLAAQADQRKLQTEGADAFVAAREGAINLRSVSTGDGLTDLIAFIRPRAYRDLALPAAAQDDWNGFGQLDTPIVAARYKARPLAGVWATAPYLHNGSVRTLYQMLSPAYERDKVFYLGGRTFDPVQVGLVSDPKAPGAFKYDTSIPGNLNTGHEFRAGYIPWVPGGPPSHGVIGPEFTPHQRLAIIEYLKVHRDDPSDHSCSVYVPLPPAPPDPPDPACAVPANPGPAKKAQP